MIHAIARPQIATAVLACTVSLALAVAVSQLQGFVEDAGINVPSQDVFADYCAGVAWAGVLALSILFWPVSSRHKSWLMAAWIVKCLVALVVMLPYEAHYSGLDCWVYFRDAHIRLAEVPARLAAGGADFVIGLGSLHLRIAPDSFHAMKLSFTMIGLLATYLLYLAAEILLERESPVAFFGLCFYPTVLFWSSILGKDPVVLLGIGAHIWGLLNVAVRKRNGYLWVALFGIALASIVRIWMGPILLVPSLVLLTCKIRPWGWRIFAIGLAACALLILVPATATRLDLGKADDIVEASRSLTRGWERANSSLALDVEGNSTIDLLLFVPQSMFIAYFRPLPGDVPHLFGHLAGAENVLLLSGSLLALLRLRLRHLRNSILVWAVLVLLTWGGAYGLVAYRDLGTAVRFKLQIVPVLLGVIWFLCFSRGTRQGGGSSRPCASC